MDFQIFYTSPALAELEAVLAWSWEKHSNSTERFALTLLNHVDLLKNFPRLGAPVSGFPNVRRLVHSPLHVYYRIDTRAARVEVLHFRHASRKPPRLP